MRNYIIGFAAFIIVIFVIALAIGQSDDTDDMAYTDEFASTEEVIDTPAERFEEPIKESAEELIEEIQEPAQPSPDFNTAAIEIPRSNRKFPEQILVRVNYTTSYNKETKCPNWVAWRLEKDKTDGPYSRKGVPYYDENYKAYGIGNLTESMARGNYITDMEAGPPRQEISDWADRPSNTDHGHICPAADNRWSKAAMNQSFLLTNMCPQDHNLNGGDWKALEDRCRGWAIHYGDIYIVAGPIFYNGITQTMGQNKVGIPDAFFKVVLCLGKKPKALGFIFPNNGTHHKLESYVLTVDEVEEITGFDFFYNLPDDIETAVEAVSNLNAW
ncbi:MAG: DNA/RNA non-specific endonuclease [Prevotella sp.]|nr:DNA/RNA non-specific endonuclease [Prevotella sp.]